MRRMFQHLSYTAQSKPWLHIIILILYYKQNLTNTSKKARELDSNPNPIPNPNANPNPIPNPNAIPNAKPNPNLTLNQTLFLTLT